MTKFGRNSLCVCGSGQKFKKCCLNQPPKEGWKTHRGTLDELSWPTEPITDELIEELVPQGWYRENLLRYREDGCGYCRERDSFVTSPVLAPEQQGQQEQDSVAQEVDSLFFSPLEPLADALIEELVAKGWDKDGLLRHRNAGRGYSRERNSILSR